MEYTVACIVVNRINVRRTIASDRLCSIGVCHFLFEIMIVWSRGIVCGEKSLEEIGSE